MAVVNLRKTLNQRTQTHPDGSRERWRDVVGYTGFYRVSDWGRLKSVDRWVKCRYGKSRLIRSRIKQTRPNHCGHHGAILHKNGKARFFFLHRLVLEAFVGPRPPGLVARHYPDRNPSNNRLANLSWNTPEVNESDKIEHGTLRRGERCWNSKLSADDVRHIRSAFASGTMTGPQAAAQYGVTKEAVYLIVHRKNWKHV